MLTVFRTAMPHDGGSAAMRDHGYIREESIDPNSIELVLLFLDKWSDSEDVLAYLMLCLGCGNLGASLV